MKRAIALLLALITMLSLCSCGSKKLTESDLQALQEDLTVFDCTLDFDGPSNNIKMFECTIEDVNTEGLLDKDYTYDATYQLAADYMQMTDAMYNSAKVIYVVLAIDDMLMGEDDYADRGISDIDDYMDSMISIVCDGEEFKSGGWTLSIVINQEDETATIIANK